MPLWSPRWSFADFWAEGAMLTRFGLGLRLEEAGGVIGSDSEVAGVRALLLLVLCSERYLGNAGLEGMMPCVVQYEQLPRRAPVLNPLL